MDDGPAGREIVRSITELAHRLDKEVVAEGIETAEQLATLRAIGCEYGQGFYFARPLPAVEAEALVLGAPLLQEAKVLAIDA